MRDDTKIRAAGGLGVGIGCLWILGVLTFWVAVIWIVLHFVAKFW